MTHIFPIIEVSKSVFASSWFARYICSSNDTITPLQSKAFIVLRTIPLHLYKAKHLLLFERYHYTFTKQSIYCYSNDTITPLQSEAFIVIQTIPLHLYKAKHLLIWFLVTTMIAVMKSIFIFVDIHAKNFYNQNIHWIFILIFMLCYKIVINTKPDAFLNS